MGLAIRKFGEDEASDFKMQTEQRIFFIRFCCFQVLRNNLLEKGESENLPKDAVNVSGILKVVNMVF